MSKNKPSAKENLTELRALMRKDWLDAFLVSVGDEFLGEYVPASEERLAWLTGFTGSAGTAVITEDKAALFVDGRYTVQAKMELPGNLYEFHNVSDKRPEEWLSEVLKEGKVVGYDPRLMSMSELGRWEKALAEKKIVLKPLDSNPVDALWQDRPEPPASEVIQHDVSIAGRTHAEKREIIAGKLKDKDADCAVLVASDSVNWLLNIRGQDVAYSPLVRAPAIIESGGRVMLYVDSDRVSPTICASMVPDVEMRAPWRLEEDLAERGSKSQRVWLDPALTPAWYAQVLEKEGAVLVLAKDPCQYPKAIKHKNELKGMREAHFRDGRAVIRFMHWLENATNRQDVTEKEASEKLLEFRRMAKEFVSPSFETIAGSGPNGAIVHYRVSSQTNRVLHHGDLFLVDSGGQYPDGTTDITRTVTIDTPSPEHCERFTQVLKGHIALSKAQFPEGTTGMQLDVLARNPLWQEGLDYDHGTGHGVGTFLNVHEGPQRISKRGGDVALKPGMVLSIEPGFYKEGQYGIRIENLAEVVEKGKMKHGSSNLFGFAPLTCVPIDRRLIHVGMLDRDEITWLDHYHRWVYDHQADELEEEVRQWLKLATKPLKEEA